MVFHDQRPVQPYRVVSIDPGTETMGVSLLELDPITLQQSFVEAFTMRGSVLNYYWGNVLHDGDGRDSRLIALEQQLVSYFQYAQPHMVVYEDNYLGASPQSFKALIEACMCIKHAIWKFNPYLASYTIKPNQAKSIVNAIPRRGMSQEERKELVRQGLMRYRPLQVPPHILAALDEHAVDSVAIGAYALQEIANELIMSEWRR